MTTVGTFDGSDFAIEYGKRVVEFEKLSHTQRLPGMTRQDVRVELEQSFYDAWRTYDEASGLTLGQYWWVVWTNRKKKVIERYFVARNPAPRSDPMPEVLEEMGEVLQPFLSAEDLCPTPGLIEAAVWRMLAEGYRKAEVERALGLTKAGLRRIVQGWRTDAVRATLTTTA
jgi:hypothetical protein